MFKLAPETIEKLKLIAQGFELSESAVCEQALERFIFAKLDEAESRLAFASLKHLSAIDSKKIRQLNYAG